MSQNAQSLQETAQNAQDTALTTDAILSVARLCKLEVNAVDAQGFADDLGKILAMMEVLQNVGTQEVAPLTNVHDATMVLRADVVNDSIDRSDNQVCAPAIKDGLYLVPQVIE